MPILGFAMVNVVRWLRMPNLSALYPEYVFPDFPAVENTEAWNYCGKLVRGLAHRVNNQAMVVQGFASLAMIEPSSTETARGGLLQMKEAAGQLSQIMRQAVLLGEGGLRPARTCAGAHFWPCLHELCTALQAEYGVEDAIQCKKNISESLPELGLDVMLFKEILADVLRGSIERMTMNQQVQGITLEVAAGYLPSGGGCLDLQIADNGPMWPGSALRRMLEPFGGTGTTLGKDCAPAALMLHSVGGRLGLSSGDSGTVVLLQVPYASGA